MFEFNQDLIISFSDFHSIHIYLYLSILYCTHAFWYTTDHYIEYKLSFNNKIICYLNTE